MSNILHLDEVRERSGKSRTTLWRDVRAGRFPAPLKLGANRIGWLESEMSYCQKLCMGLSCGGAILAFSIHEFDASNDLGELI